MRESVEKQHHPEDIKWSTEQTFVNSKNNIQKFYKDENWCLWRKQFFLTIALLQQFQYNTGPFIEHLTQSSLIFCFSLQWLFFHISDHTSWSYIQTSCRTSRETFSQQEKSFYTVRNFYCSTYVHCHYRASQLWQTNTVI